MSNAELVERLMRSAHRLRRASAKSLAPLGLTPAQERMLRLVARGDGPWRMGELATRMGIVPRSATSLVGALEEAGLVERAIDPDNRRSILVRLTAQGEDLQREMAAARAQAGERLFADLDDRERALLAELLDKVAPADAGSGAGEITPDGGPAPVAQTVGRPTTR
ncbi:MarR family winged helix-turn-helix transcriptional regulator [Nakamurella panacisegetis]|uniref:MarR family winged helix-turn-helix transcriptional regulator n=1 Tax=Nakamurella panacisegetis TaxID=1090615 RepID=UPI0018D48662|nr:MarR family transcriptional regulator [Nakamurella panacisegetis]